MPNETDAVVADAQPEPTEETQPNEPSISMYVEDEPDAGVQESGDSEQESDEGDQDAEAEPDVADDSDDETDSELTPDDGPPTTDPKGHNRDAALTKLQQRQTTFERSIDTKLTELQGQLNSSLESLTKAIEGATKTDKPPTEKQSEKIEDAVDEVEEILQALDDADIVEGQQVKKLVQSLVKKLDTQLKSGPKSDDIEALKEAHAKAQEQLAEITAERESQAARIAFLSTFAQQHPTLADRVDELIDQAVTNVKGLPIQLADDAYKGAIDAEFYRLVREEESKPAEEEEAPEPAKKPVKKKPAGVSTVPAGVSSRTATKPAATPDPPMWIPD